MNSIGLRLFAILTLTTGLVWLAAALWINAGTRVQLEEVLDGRLVEAARMVDTLIVERDGRDLLSPREDDLSIVGPVDTRSPHFTCQIWSAAGQLLGRSAGAPDAQLSSHASGFTDTVIDGQRWRVYAIENEEAGIRILMADNLEIRDQLANGLVVGLLLPAVLIIPSLAGLIWLCVRGGLRPLRRLTEDLEGREAGELTPVYAANAPYELRPMMLSLNALFERIGRLREHERDFIAFAAHELRTPLAGLKAQAEIALASQEPDIRSQALGHVVVSVERVGRLLRQLLDLSEVEAEGTQRHAVAFKPVHLVRRLWSDARYGERGLSLRIDPTLWDATFDVDEGLFDLALRNIVENATNHSPPNGIVECGWLASDHEAGGDATLMITDEGKGVSAEELPKLTERFFRGRHKTKIGSGLGLSIAELSLTKAGCGLSIENREPTGLRVTIRIPQNLVTIVPSERSIAAPSPSRLQPA